MQPIQTNNADSSVEISSAHSDLTQATEGNAPQTVEYRVGEATEAHSFHAARLTDAIKATGLFDRFDFTVDERLIHTYNSSYAPEAGHDIRTDDLPCNKLLLAARFFSAHQSYEIIGFRIKLVELSHGNLAVEAIIEVIAEIAAGSDGPVMNILFEDIDDPMAFLMLPNAMFEMLCEECIENARDRIDSFFDESIQFLKQVLSDPRFSAF